MLMVVVFEDNPTLGDVRRRHIGDHLAFLERNARLVRAAGPLETPEGAPAGGLWIVDAKDAAEVDALVKQDPFWPTGLRKSVTILAWSQVFADGKRLGGNGRCGMGGEAVDSNTLPIKPGYATVEVKMPKDDRTRPESEQEQ